MNHPLQTQVQGKTCTTPNYTEYVTLRQSSYEDDWQLTMKTDGRTDSPLLLGDWPWHGVYPTREVRLAGDVPTENGAN